MTFQFLFSILYLLVGICKHSIIMCSMTIYDLINPFYSWGNCTVSGSSIGETQKFLLCLLGTNGVSLWLWCCLPHVAIWCCDNIVRLSCFFHREKYQSSDEIPSPYLHIQTFSHEKSKAIKKCSPCILTVYHQSLTLSWVRYFKIKHLM